MKSDRAIAKKAHGVDEFHVINFHGENFCPIHNLLGTNELFVQFVQYKVTVVPLKSVRYGDHLTLHVGVIGLGLLSEPV